MADVRVMPSRTGFHRRLKIVRQGWFYLFISFALGVAALNTGNNLLFLSLGLLLGLISISGLLSEANVRTLELVVRGNALAVVGAPHQIEIALINRHRRRTVFAVTPRLSWVRCQPVLAAAQVAEVSTSILQIGPGETITAHCQVVFGERGDYELFDAVIETDYPFGLFKKIAVLNRVQSRVLVAPAPDPEVVEKRAQALAGGAFSGQGPGQGIEPYDVVEAEPDEDIRNVAWAKSASRGRLVAIRRASEAGDALVIAIPRGTSGEPEFERRLRRAAALVKKRLAGGAPTGLATDRGLSPIAAGTAHERGLMAILACVSEGFDGNPGPLARRQGAGVIWA